MTTPPAGENPNDGRPPRNVPPGYPYGPPPYGPPPYGPPPGYAYGPPPQPTPRISVGMVVLGAVVYMVTNLVIGFVAVILASSATGGGANVMLIATAVVLAAIAFGLGGPLLAARSPQRKGFGLGLMIGWALTSLFTVGICTGINPSIYSS